MKKVISVMVLALALLQSSPAILAQGAGPSDSTDRSPHRVRLVTVAPDLQLEVLDWGGTSDALPLVFLAGLTNNAHTFDDFAPRFARDFHPVGITRRGHGASSWPDSGYDTAARVRDIRTVFDALNLRRAILVGHSLAGEEMTRFATEHPERVQGLVYIDAAYDYSKLLSVFQLCPDSSGPEVVARRHFKNPGAYIHTQLKVGADGTLGPNASLSALQQIVASQSPPEYSGVRAPALGAYYFPARVEDVIANPSPECVSALQRYYYSGAAAFAEGVQRATVVTFSGSQHNIHLASPDGLYAAMRTWLAKVTASR